MRIVAVALAWLGTFAVPTMVVAQHSRTVRGTALSAVDGAPLQGALVRSLDGPAQTLSDRLGSFSLAVATDSARLLVAQLGFAPETLRVAPRTDRIVIRLRPASLQLEPNVVTADPAFSTASSSVIRALDIQLRPRESSQQLLALTPGLLIAQHAGGGKAEQIFLRGFDADHGTDVAVSVDGSPVNMVTHAHGQGYADLHHVIPEVVDQVEVRKGPYGAEDGDLATAGAVSFITRDRARPAAEVRGGSFGTGRAYAILPFGGDATASGGYVAGAYAYSEGPYDAAQGYSRSNLFGKWTTPVRDSRLTFTLSGTDARWDASGQIPGRAVASGQIGRFGSIDPTEGGATHRYDASVALDRRSDGNTR